MKNVRCRDLAADPSLGCGNFLAAALRASADVDAPRIFLHRPFVARGGETIEALSLAKLDELARREAWAYAAAGVKPRDPVAVSLPDGIEYLIHFIALTSLGAIAVLVNPEMKPALAAGFIERVGAIGLVADPERLTAIVAHLGAPLRFASSFLESGSTNALPSAYPFVHAPEDPVLLCHSSGTTGIPKAVTFQHHAFFHGVRHRLAEGAPPRRLLTALPHSHSAGIAFPMLALLRDEPIYMVKGDDAPAVLAAAAAFKATTVVAFAHTFVEISQVTDASTRFDLSCVRAWINTGDAAHVTHIKKLVQLGGPDGSVFVDGLGSSEMGFSLFQIVHSKGSAHAARCVGKPLEFVDAQVLGDNGELLGANEVGRLGVRSPTVTCGYWNDSVLTFRSRLSGYWLTGDLARKDDEGNFYHVDRVSDAIRTRDGVVHSLLTEEILQRDCPDIVDVCVVGAQRDNGVEVPVALVRPLDERQPGRDEAEWLAELNRVLAARQMPLLDAVFLPASWGKDVPTGPTGKVLKRELRLQVTAEGRTPRERSRLREFIHVTSAECGAESH